MLLLKYLIIFESEEALLGAVSILISLYSYVSTTFTIRKHVKTKLDEDPDFNELPGKGPWQCVVGKSFAASLTHEAGKMIK